MSGNSEARSPARGPGLAVELSSAGGDLVGLGALGALDDLEVDPLALFQALVPVHLDGRVVDEDVLTAVDGDEAEALLGVEPLHGALCHVCSHVSCVRTAPPDRGTGISLFRPSDTNVELEPRETVHEELPGGTTSTQDERRIRRRVWSRRSGRRWPA